MAETEPKTIVHPIAGFDFRMVPNGVAITVRYYVKSNAVSDDAAQPNFVTQAVTVGLTEFRPKR